jgi:TPR repeat protein
MGIFKAHIRKCYAGLSFLLIFLALVLYDFHPAVKLEFQEDRIVENITAGLFLITFLSSLALLLDSRNINYRKALIIVMALGLLGFLDELSFGQRIFNFQVPYVFGFPLDAAHDIVAITLKVIKKYLFLSILLSLITISILSYLARNKIPYAISVLKSLLFDRSYTLLLFFGVYLFIAIAIEEVFRNLHLPALDNFLQPLEEVLELNAALALLFFCLSIRWSRKWTLVGSALIASIAIGTTFLPTHAAQWMIHDKAGTRAYEQRDLTEAQEQYAAAAKEAEKIGPRDYRLGSSLNNLAVLHQGKGNLATAESLYRRSLAIQEKAFGARHLKVANVLGNLAGLSFHQGKLEEVEPLLLRALAIYENFLGRDHEKVATTLVKMAILKSDKGELGEAASFYERALAINTKLLGPDHSQVMEIRYNLAIINRAGAKFEAALKELRSLAEKGHAEGQYALAEIYLKGGGVRRDYVQAFKWLNLSGLLLPAGDLRTKSARLLARVSKNMSPAQIAKARGLVREWWGKHKNTSQQ